MATTFVLGLTSGPENGSIFWPTFFFVAAPHGFIFLGSSCEPMLMCIQLWVRSAKDQNCVNAFARILASGVASRIPQRPLGIPHLQRHLYTHL